MATVDMVPTGEVGLPGRRNSVNVQLLEVELDWADVLTTKGSALAASDVIQALQIPANTFVMAAGIEVVTAADSTALTLDLGDGSDADGFVDGDDGKTTGYNVRTLTLTEGTPNTVTGYSSGKFYSAADTLDVTFATLTGTLTSGVIRVFAIVCDLDPQTVNAGTARDATDA